MILKGLFGIVRKEHTQMADYWKNITEIKNKQTEKGLREYGQTLEENKSIPTIERITMVEEEMVDALMYLEHLKASIKDGLFS